MVEQIREMLDMLGSLEAFQDRLIETYPMMSTAQLADTIAGGLGTAMLAGRHDTSRGGVVGNILVR